MSLVSVSRRARMGAPRVRCARPAQRFRCEAPARGSVREVTVSRFTDGAGPCFSPPWPNRSGFVADERRFEVSPFRDSRAPGRGIP